MEMTSRNPLVAGASDGAHSDSKGDVKAPKTFDDIVAAIDHGRYSTKTKARLRRVRMALRNMNAAGEAVAALKTEVEVSKLVGHGGTDFRRRRELARQVTEPWMADPRSTGRMAWDVALLQLVLVTLLMTPFELGFNFVSDTAGESGAEIFFGWFEIFMITFFFADICLNFRTAYIVDDQIHQDPKEVATAYLRMWFWIDLAATVPISEIVGLFQDAPDEGDESADATSVLRFLRFFRLIRLLRMLRALRLSQLLTNFGELGVIAESALRFVRLTFWMLITGHTISCGWQFIADVNGYGEDTWAYAQDITADTPVGERYTTALYFAFTTLTTVGYGDISAVSFAEKWYLIVCQIGGIMLFSYIVAKLTTLAAQREASALEYQQKIDSVNEFLHARNLGPELRDDVRNYYDAIWSRGISYSERAILDELSFGMRRKVLRALHAQTVARVPFFDGADQVTVDDIIRRLEPSIAMPKDVIVEEGEIGQHIFLLRIGLVEESFKGVHIRDLSNDSFFGHEIALELAAAPMDPEKATVQELAAAVQKTTPRRATTVTAVEVCELALLSIAAVLELMEEYPSIREAIGKVAVLRQMDLAKRGLDDGDQPGPARTAAGASAAGGRGPSPVHGASDGDMLRRLASKRAMEAVSGEASLDSPRAFGRDSVMAGSFTGLPSHAEGVARASGGDGGSGSSSSDDDGGGEAEVVDGDDAMGDSAGVSDRVGSIESAIRRRSTATVDRTPTTAAVGARISQLEARLRRIEKYQSESETRVLMHINSVTKQLERAIRQASLTKATFA